MPIKFLTLNDHMLPIVINPQSFKCTKLLNAGLILNSRKGLYATDIDLSARYDVCNIQIIYVTPIVLSGNDKDRYRSIFIGPYKYYR